MSASYDHLGFTLATVRHYARLRTVARFRCVECGELLDLNVKSGAPLDPEGYVKRAKQLGWRAEKQRRSRTYCPGCAGPRRPKDLNQAPEPSPKEKSVIMASNVTTLPAAPAASRPEPREPTGDQRLRIRALLDKHFDDAAGCYLDGYSDQRIAEEVNVPRVIVERIREAAYGPLKVSPEVSALRADIVRLTDEIIAAHNDYKERISALANQVRDAGARLEKIEKAVRT